ncbi:MAG: hypothetical protein MUC63_07195, partial [Planctomycetes bacterium]|nr:hypothetical protein [Planctomycetota bacterium]
MSFLSEVPSENQARAHRRRVLILAAAGLLAVLLSAAAALWFVREGWSNRVVVVNAGREPLRSLSIALRETDGTLRLERSAESLAPGKRWIVRRTGTDFSLDLGFEFEGSPRRHRENYVDLWAGEDCTLEILANGSVRS